MVKINKIFKIDVGLIPTFLGVIVTGIGTHIASERGSHEAWHNWTATHIAFCLVFLILMYFHMSQHWTWYKSLLTAGNKKRGVTIALSVIFLFETLSGLILIAFVDGDISFCGHFHWIFGILLSIFGIRHFLKRLSRLKKGLKLTKKTLPN